MLHKLFILAGAFLTAGVVLLSTMPSRVYAQCGINSPSSSCVVCHEVQALVSNEDEWHTIHARKDCCTNCHGGNCSAADKDRAHESMIPNPLEDIYTNCHACHPDYPERAARFATELGITPSSRKTPTPIPIPLDEPQPPDLVLPADLSSIPAPQPPIGLINTGLLLLAILIYGLIRQEKRRVIH